MSEGAAGTAKGTRPAAATPDLCVIGAGAGGIAVATAAAAFGVPVVLVERDRTGGRDAGLVVKALVEAASRLQEMRDAARLGIAAAEAPTIDAARLHDHVRRALSVPAANHRAERLQALGITLLHGEGRFVSRSTLAVGDRLVTARRFVVATGSKPVLPPALAGLDPGLVSTEDDLATMTRLPESLLVLGRGGRAVALAQALKRLGSDVGLISPGGLLPSHDPEAVMLLRQQLLREEVTVLEGELHRAESGPEGLRLTLERAGSQETFVAKHLLLAGDREAEIDGLDLDLAGIRRDAQGIAVDTGLRTANRRVYAIGSCAGGAAAGASDHAGEEHAGLVLGHALFRRAGRLAPALNPRIVWSRPEIASVGAWTQTETIEPGALRFLRASFAEMPAAAAAGDTQGFVKLVSDAKGRIRGVTIVGTGAAEMIAPWSVAIKAGMTVAEIGSIPSATLSKAEASRLAALSFHRPSTTSRTIRRLIGLLRRFG